MSIFGEERKIKFTKNGTTVLVDHCVILRSEPEPKTIMHESIITRHREWIDIYDHWIVECIAYLCKYTDPVSAYENFRQYEGALVDEVYEYADKFPFLDENLQAVRFRLDKIKPVYIETDEYPDELRFTFKSEKTVSLQTLKMPTDIPNLWLWFNDDTLTNPSSNLFQWVDKVSGDIILSGNYGAGSGLTQINGKNVLDVSSSENNENQLNQSFFLPNEMTFIGVVHFNFPDAAAGFICHNWIQQGYPIQAAAHSFAFKQHSYTLSGDDPLYWEGFRHSCANSFSPLYEIGFAGTTEPTGAEVPYIPTFFSLSYNSSLSVVDLKINSNDYSTGDEIPISRQIALILLNYSMKGEIFEFMFYNRKLTTTEINDLKKYYKTKYNITNDIGII